VRTTTDCDPWRMVRFAGTSASRLFTKDHVGVPIMPELTESEDQLAAERDSLRSLAGALTGALRLCRDRLTGEMDADRYGSYAARCAVDAALARAAEMRVGN